MHHHHAHHQAAPTVCCPPVSLPMSCNRRTGCMSSGACSCCQTLATPPCACSAAASCCSCTQHQARCCSTSAFASACPCGCPAGCTCTCCAKKATPAGGSSEGVCSREKALAALAKAVHPQCVCAEQATSGEAAGKGGELASTSCGCPLVVMCGCGPDCKKCDCKHGKAGGVDTRCGATRGSKPDRDD